MKATKLSAVAMAEGGSDVIEVRLRAAEDGLEVLQNQRSLSFAEQSWLDLKGKKKKKSPGVPPGGSPDKCMYYKDYIKCSHLADVLIQSDLQ